MIELSSSTHLSLAPGSKTMRLLAIQILILSLVSLAALMTSIDFANAQNEKKSTTGASGTTTSNSGQSKRTTVNFEDQLVEGQTQKPELFYLLQQRNNNFKRLIKLRENFLPEMRKTSEEMNGKGSGS